MPEARARSQNERAGASESARAARGIGAPASDGVRGSAGAQPPEKIYDVIIVGSGHSGGMAAYVLARKGLSCLMLNAGPVVDVNKDRPITPASELPYRGFRRPGALSDGPLDEYRLSAFVHPEEVPYTTDPDKPFVWVRNRVVGSRSIFWSRQSFRLSDFEFKQRDFEGGVDQNWPVNLAEMAPYYERVEEIFRISGHPEGLPQFPDPKFALVTAKPQPNSQVMQRFWNATGRRNIRISVSRSSMGQNNLASSVNLLLPDAFASGNLTLVPDAVVRELSLNKATGLVDGVHYVERLTRREMQAKARVVVLAAGSLESVRLLLNSGLANSSGLLGHYIFDQLYADVVQGFVPEALDGKGQGVAGGGGFLPPFRNVGGATNAPDFTGRYALSVTSGGTPSDDVLGTFGEELQRKRAHYSGAGFSATMMGAVLPRKENHVRINTKVSDAWGIPVLHISAAYGDNERRMQTDAQDQMAELMKECGVELLMKSDARREFGQSVHELGGCRMGDDPRTSVLNRWNQTHDIKNLLVVDGSSFVTGGWQNPTMTISAVAMRAAEHLAEEMRQGL